jgi:hypothetical protein
MNIRPPFGGKLSFPGQQVIPVTEMAVPASEWSLLESRRDAAMKKLQKFEDDNEKPNWINRAYPVDIDLPLFTGSSTAGGYPASFGVFNVDSGSTFFALGIEAFYTCTGVLSEDNSPATLTLPETLRPSVFDYTWSIRDSITDRDWSNIPLPSAVIRTGNMGLFGIGAQARIGGGTRITITVNPTYFDSSSTSTGLKTFSSHSLQFILSGIAIKDGAL